MSANEKRETPAADEAKPLKQSVRPVARPGGPKALIGITIGERYRLERLLGEGGMGAVYQAEHVAMRKRMAIKVLHPEMTRLPEVVERFNREAMAAAHIEHPNVVTATDFGKLEDGSFYLALEFVEGKSLREVIAEGRLDLGRALHVARQIAAALQRAHSLKIVHRDLKPENVMLVERDGDPDFVKVLDFGIAKVQIGELGSGDSAERNAGPKQNILTQAGMVYGTPEYMAPEQALGQPVDARADLYALGVIMYEMLCGVRPFEADSKVALLGMQVTAPVPAMATKAPDAKIPSEVEHVVGRLLAKEASQRTSDARELIEGISTVLYQLAATGVVDPRYVPSPTSGRVTNPSLLSGIGEAPSASLMTASAPIAGASQSGVAGSTPPTKAGLFGNKAWLIAAGGGLFGILVLVTAIAMVFRGREHPKDGADGGTSTSADADVGEQPLDARVSEAVALIKSKDYNTGIKKLEELGPEAQGRDDVHRALAEGYFATNRARDALREVGQIFKVNPALDLTKEVDLRVMVRNTAVRDPSGENRAAVDDAFALLETQMGTVGWDDIYDIAYGQSGVAYPKAAARAKTVFARGDRAKMSPALATTQELALAGTNCRLLEPMLPKAAAQGDERTLFVLKQLLPPRGIVPGEGFRKARDNLACIHADKSLDKAIAELEGRLKKR